MTPEAAARQLIDRALEAAGWVVQDRAAVNLRAARGVAIREFPLKSGHGFADYLLYVDGKAAGAIEAKPEGTPLIGVEPQSDKYARGLPDHLPAVHRPLPFVYESSGTETRFTNGLDPHPRSRRIFHVHAPEELAEWLEAPPLPGTERPEGRDYEPADRLLQRILAERRRRWEQAELEKMRAKGKEPKGEAWKKKYKEPEAPDVSSLPALPEGWCWADVDAIAHVQGGLTKGKKRKPDDVLREVPYLRVANVQRGFLDLEVVKTIPATPDEIEKLRLVPGDVLFNEGGDRDKLGRGWIWSGEIEDCIHQNHVFRARLLTADILPKYLSWYGNSAGRNYFFDQGKQTTNLASINLTKLRGLPIAIPPLAEQERIQAAVEDSLSILESNLRAVQANLRRADRLRQSILKRAFEGKLVPQDPDDEPASVLLERIRAEREEASDNGKARKRRQRRAASKG